MPQTSQSERVGPGTDPKSFSCLACRQRKVKCDRRNPCSNCIRAAKQCSFIPPLRGKPKRRKAPKEGLHAKLKRYEEMLKSYGASIEPSEDGNVSDVEIMSCADVEMTGYAESHDEIRGGHFAYNKTKIRLITKNGSSKYFDNGIWSNFGDEFNHPEEECLYESVDGPNVQSSDPFVDSPDENGLVLGTFSRIENLASLHYPFHILQKMLDFYVNRVDPLAKVLHIPTFWRMQTNALQNPHGISKSMEALTFTFYLATITSLEDDECYRLLGEQKTIISARYKLAAYQALINASFLQTSSLMTLQAYVIFLMSMRSQYHRDSLFTLSGIAVRLGRRMGLHRDGTLLGLSPFETEMRRRLWWQIVHVDCHTSDSSGTKPSMDLFLGDTKMPLNVEDEDLSPDMVSPPSERIGITSIVLCLIRCDIADFLRKVTPELWYDARRETLSSLTITLAEKDNMINQVEDLLETKYLRYYDPSNPLHYFSSILARSSICKMKLLAHNPRQFVNCGVKIPQTSRDIIFANGTKLMEYASLMHSNHSLRKFTWQTGMSYLWYTLLYVLIEIRHRLTGPEVDHAWQLIGAVLSNYPQIFAQASGTLYAALGNWTLQVWDDCVAARKLDGLPESPTPEYISAIRHARRPLAESSSKANFITNPGQAIGNSTDYGEVQPLNNNLITDLETTDSYDFSNLLSFDLEPNEWAQWEHLLSGQGC